MSEYTKKSENIYFLNDKNITSSLIDDSVLSNAIPSHELFKGTYDGLSTYDNNLCIEVSSLNTKTNTISSNLCSEVKNLSDSLSIDLSNEISSRIKAVQDLSTSLSNTTDEKFVLKTGDTIEKLSVIGELKVLDKAIFNNSVELKKNVIIGNAKIPQNYNNMFVWNGSDRDEYIGKLVDNATGNTFSINPIHELCGVFVGDKSLCAYITEDVALTSDNIRGEINTVSSLLTGNYALSSDVSAVSKLVNDAGYLVSDNFDFKYDSDTKAIWLSAGNKPISVDATDFIKDGMIDTVSVITENRTYPELQITFNTDSGKDIISISLEKLVDIYKSNTDGISVENYKIGLDFNTVAKTENLNQLSTSFRTISTNHENRLITAESNINSINKYTYKLSSNNGIIDTLSNTIDNNIRNIGTISSNLQTAETDINKLKEFKSTLTGDGGSIDIINDNISILQREIANNATFGEHIVIGQDDINRTLAEIFDTHGLINPGSNPETLKNGNIYRVELLSVSDLYPNILDRNTHNYSTLPLSTRVTASFTTKDGFKLVHGDYIVIHSHDKDYVELTDLISCVEVIPSVRFDEFNKLSARADTNYFWLSGNNNQEVTWIGEDGLVKKDHSIGGNNYFKDINYFEGISASIISSNNISAINLTSDSLSASLISVDSLSASKLSADSLSASLISVDSLSASKLSAYNMSVDNLSARNISVDWKNVKHSDNGYSLYDLSVALSNKIYIDDRVDKDINGTSDLSIVKISKEDYDNTVALETTPLSANVLYIVDSNYIDAYGQVIRNLTMDEDLTASEATNKHYVDSLCASLSDTVVLSVGNLQNQIITETARAEGIESGLRIDLDKEINRSTTKDNELDQAIKSETARAEDAETKLNTKIETETQARIDADSALNERINTNAQDITTEIARAKNVEEALEANINTKADNNKLSNYILKSVIIDALSDITTDSELSDIRDALISLKTTLTAN